MLEEFESRRHREDCCAMKEKFLPQRKYKRKYTQRIRRGLLRNDGNREEYRFFIQHRENKKEIDRGPQPIAAQ